jgi:predicted TIM-barrel fold metal-dependent hydrolase
MTNLFLRHPKTTFIWAHIGLGRVVRPVKDQATFIEAILANPRLKNVNFDISWTETAKYLDATPQTVEIVADIMRRYPDRFLFGSDDVAPTNEKDYLAVYDMYRPLWQAVPPEVATAVKKTNYERIFDDARRKVRFWEDEQRNRVRVLGRR